MYPYSFDYRNDSSVAGYKGPITISLADGDIASGLIDPIDNRTIIRNSIARILGTALGQRVMRPEFGNSLKSMLFEEIDGNEIETIREELSSILDREEPRIIVQSIDVESYKDNHYITCMVKFRYRNTGIDDNFAYNVKA